MKNSAQNKKTEGGFGIIEILLVVIVVGVLGATGWYAFHTKHQTDQILNQAQKEAQNIPPPSLLPSDWLAYENKDVGFRLIYPSYWGSPEFNNADDSVIKGHHYDVQFIKPEANYTISIDMDSDNLLLQGASDAGYKTVGPDMTKSSIISRLAEDKKGLIKYDQTSFAVLEVPEILRVNQIVSLPKLDISAGYGTYEVFQLGPSCPQNALASNSAYDCITNTIYNDLSKSLKSIVAI